MAPIPQRSRAIELDQAARSTGSQSRENLPISQARDLLDWLEGQGIRPAEVAVEAGGTMTVRWDR